LGSISLAQGLKQRQNLNRNVLSVSFLNAIVVDERQKHEEKTFFVRMCTELETIGDELVDFVSTHKVQPCTENTIGLTTDR